MPSNRKRFYQVGRSFSTGTVESLSHSLESLLVWLNAERKRKELIGDIHDVHVKKS